MVWIGFSARLDCSSFSQATPVGRERCQEERRTPICTVCSYLMLMQAHFAGRLGCALLRATWPRGALVAVLSTLLLTTVPTDTRLHVWGASCSMLDVIPFLWSQADEFTVGLLNPHCQPRHSQIQRLLGRPRPP